MSFKSIFGQNKAIETLQGFIKNNRSPRAMIFAGPAGVGKATAALEFAKALNCLHADARAVFDSCGLCQNCKHIDSRTHHDVIFAGWELQAALREEEVEKQQHIRIDTARYIANASQQKPALAKWKVYIIDNAEKLEIGAANALLKFIEEPSPDTVWILVSSKKEAMLPTIKSRCQTINFAPLAQDVIENILDKDFIKKDLAKKAAFYGEGSVTKAKLSAELMETFAATKDGAAFAHQAADGLPKVLSEARLLLNAMLDMLTLNAHKKWLKANDRERETLQSFLRKLIFYKTAAARNVSPQLVAQAALIRAEEIGINLKER
jgi:DNA polymerase III delta' subunit